MHKKICFNNRLSSTSIFTWTYATKELFSFVLGNQFSTSDVNITTDGIYHRDDNADQDATDQPTNIVTHTCKGHCSREDPNEILVAEEAKEPDT